MTPDIQEECMTKPEEEVKMEEEEENAKLEELKTILMTLKADDVLAILLQSIVKAVLEESKTRVVEEMVAFRRCIAERMLNCQDHKMNDSVDLLKLDESFRAGWNKWLETPHEQRAEEAFKVFESRLFGNEDKQEEDEAER